MSKKQKQIPFIEYDSPVVLTAQKIDEYGVGIAYHDGYEIYLENVLDGETVKAEILPPFANGSKRRPATVLEYIKKSDDREDHDGELSNLSVYAFGAMKYEATLRRKAQMIKDALKEADIDYKDDIKIVPSSFDEPCRYKSIRYFANQSGQIIQGFYKPRSHQVMEVRECQFEPEWFSKFSCEICDLFNSCNVLAYDEERKSGLVRSITLRDTKKGRLCALSVSSMPEQSILDAYKTLCEKFSVEAIFVNLHGNESNKVIDGKVISLGKKQKIDLLLSGFNFKADSRTFLQVNYPVAEKLYKCAVDYCKTAVKDNKNNESNALDLCCGVGTMTLQLSSHFSHVTGVEIVEESIEAAKINAQENNVHNVSFICSDIKKCIKDLTNKNVDALICDPSRVGIGEDACLSLCSLKQGVKLSYIFCSLKALSRDIKTLCKNGYTLEKVIGFDMFPYTSHVETVALLYRQNM